MKNIVFALISLFAVSCNNNTAPIKQLEDENKLLKGELELYKSLEANRQKAIQHAETRSFKLENEREILSILFDTEDFDIEERAVWTPNFAERIDFPVSYDGFCYTKVSKVLHYNNDFKRAIVIFGTYNIKDNGEPDEGQTSAPMLSVAYFTERNEGAWELTSFKKTFKYHGSWGEVGDIEVKQMGKRTFVLNLSWGYSHMGETQSWTAFYSIPDFSPIFTLITGQSFKGFENGDKRSYAYESKISIDASLKEYGDILVATTGTKPNEEEDGVAMLANNDQLFVFDEKVGAYVEKIEPVIVEPEPESEKIEPNKESPLSEKLIEQPAIVEEGSENQKENSQD